MKKKKKKADLERSRRPQKFSLFAVTYSGVRTVTSFPTFFLEGLRKARG